MAASSPTLGAVGKQVNAAFPYFVRRMLKIVRNRTTA